MTATYETLLGIMLKKRTKLDIKTLGCPNNALSSQTEKFIWATTFSHYLGLKHIRTTKILKIYAFFHPNQAVQSVTT